MKIYKFEEFKELVLSGKLKCEFLEDFKNNVFEQYRAKMNLINILITDINQYIEFDFIKIFQDTDLRKEPPNRLTIDLKRLEEIIDCRFVEFNNIKELIGALSKELN